jgi:hypothetical protein
MQVRDTTEAEYPGRHVTLTTCPKKVPVNGATEVGDRIVVVGLLIGFPHANGSGVGRLKSVGGSVGESVVGAAVVGATVVGATDGAVVIAGAPAARETVSPSST